MSAATKTAPRLSRPAASAPRDRARRLSGRTFDFYRDTLGTLQELHGRHGPAVWTRAVPGLPVLCLSGPDALEVCLRNADDAFSNRQGWRLFLDHVFPGAILATDGEQHRVQRRILQQAFTTPALRDYVARIVPSLGAGMDRWLPAQQSSGELRAYPALKRLTLDVATSTFMGVAPGAEAERVNRAFVDLVEASIAVVRLDLWPTSYHRGRRGRRLLEERFASLIGEKRRTALPDLFSRMCSAVSEEGERFSDREVIDHMTFVMMAAHDTSTSTLATAVWLLATHPEWQERLRHGSLGRPDHLDYDGLMDLEEIGWVAQEALRIHPPLPVFPRGVAKPVTVNGWDLEPGTLVCLSPILTHHDLSLWTEPTRFDPERFSPERQEHRSHKYAWAPFGGGVHQCLGQRFGTLEIRAALHLMLRRWRWSVRPGYRMPYQHVPIAKPMDDLPIRIERLSA